MLIGLIVTASILLMLVRPRGVAEVWWVGSGVLLLLVMRAIPLSLAAHAAAKGYDVYLFLIGMMLISELAKEYGVFDWVASLVVGLAKGSCSGLFVLVYLAGTLVTIVMSNDATAVVLTPAILTAVRRAKAPALPYLFACALIANAASFVLPISNPANLVVFRGGMPSLGVWVGAFGVPSLASIVTTYFALRWVFRKDLRGRIEDTTHGERLRPDGRLVLAGIVFIVVVLLTASLFEVDLGMPTCVSAVVLTVIVCLRSRRSPLPLLREISWSTILLVAGLFILVDATESLGLLHWTRNWLEWAEKLGLAASAIAVGSLWLSVTT